MIEGLSDPVGIQCERISGIQPRFAHLAIPFLKNPQHRAGGIKSFQRIVAAKQQRAEMPAIHVAQPSGCFFILGEK